MMEYQVTLSESDGVLAIETDTVFNDVRENIMRQVADTRERMIHDALVKLGWTPPPNWTPRS